ncbi:hypothetical protein T484DRAFT_1650193, partial [Baffinella frigidus]
SVQPPNPAPLNPEPETRNPKPETRNPKPHPPRLSRRACVPFQATYPEMNGNVHQNRSASAALTSSPCTPQANRVTA